MNTENIKAGTKIIMIHKQRQEFLKTSKLGEVTQVNNIFNIDEIQINKTINDEYYL